MASRRVRLHLPCPEATEPELPPPPPLSALTIDLLEEILLRVASPADLARASIACFSFRRIIAHHYFLRRYRSTHPPLLLGFVTSCGFHPVEAPHPSAAVARAVARAADFSLDDFPRCNVSDRWHVWHVRNGRVLVSRHREKGPIHLDLVVYDPLSRRRLLLPAITDDLLGSVELLNQRIFHPLPSFIPSRGPSGGIEEDTSSFSVILSLQSETRLEVFVFSSVSGCWSVIMSTNWDSVWLDKILVPGQYANDCFYWKLFRVSMLMKLDMNTMQFCTVDLPPGHDKRAIVIVESERNKIAMFSLNYEGKSVDYYTFSQNGSENSHEWHMMSTVPLPVDYNYDTRRWSRGPAEGYIFLEGTSIEHDAECSVFFSLEIKTFKIEKVSISRKASSGHPYFGFPPSLSPIRTQGYRED